MQNQVSDGRAIDYAAQNAVAGGELIKLSGMVAVACADIPAGEVGAAQVTGVFELPKASGAITQGAPVYVNTQGKITATASATFAGVAWRAAAASDATVEVAINFGSAPAASSGSGGSQGGES